jgi:hypothetical protein
MNRREFVVLSATVVGAGLPSSAQALPRPKLVFFGMTVFDEVGAGYRALCPRAGAHMPFFVGELAVLNNLVRLDRIVRLSKGLEEAHGKLADFPRGACLDGDQRYEVTGSGSTTLDPKLRARLPELATIAAAGTMRSHVFSSPGGAEFELSGGTLRESTYPSESPGTKPGVMYRISIRGKEVAKDLNLTDLAVFESNGPTLRVSWSQGPGSVVLEAGEELWVLNFPVVAKPDTTPNVIEHAHDWFEMVGLKKEDGLVVERMVPVPRRDDTRKTPFRHPCLSDDRLKALGSPAPDLKRELPPDSDPCFQVLR